jgi:putative CocE/NonD family hydrolase
MDDPAQAGQGITVEFDVPAFMRDGTVLRANVYRPAGRGPWPVLLTRTPYTKDLPGAGAVLDPVQAARRGYVVVVQDTRGRFRSEGEWYPFRHEADDGADTVAWAAGLPGADGQVGMFGASYHGFTQWAAAIRRPPALKAMVPFITWHDPLDGLTYRGGALELGTTASWTLQQGINVLFRRHAGDPAALSEALAVLVRHLDGLGRGGYRALPLAAFAPLRAQDVAPSFFDNLAAPMDRERNEAWTIAGKHGLVDVPALNVGGWYDIYLNSTLAHYEAMRALGRPTRLLVGPWPHGAGRNPVGELNFGFGAQVAAIDLKTDLGALQLRWFDHWLKGLDTGIMAEPPVSLFVMGANVWRAEPAWPLARAADTPYYLRAGGLLSPEGPGAEAPDGFTYDPADPVPTRGGALLMPPEYPPGPFDQRPLEARPDVLVYSTPPLERATEVTGPVRVRLWAASSAPDTDFVARLTDVYPDGRSINLADGIVRARYRAFGSGAPPSLIEPGRAYAYGLDLWATSNVFAAGHRIRLQVTSSCFPRWDRNPNTGHAFGADAELRVARQEVLHDREHPSHVVLPLVPV